MKNNKILGVALWGIAFLATHLIIFVIPESYTTAIWIIYGFTIFAFLSQLALWLWIWRKEISVSAQFLHTSVLTVSAAYLLLQLIVDLLFVLIAASIKAVVLANALLAIVMGSLLILSLIAKNAIRRVDKRQKDYHIKL